MTPNRPAGIDRASNFTLFCEVGQAVCDALSAECIDHTQLRQLEVETRCHDAQAIADRRRPRRQRLVAA